MCLYQHGPNSPISFPELFCQDCVRLSVKEHSADPTGPHSGDFRDMSDTPQIRQDHIPEIPTGPHSGECDLTGHHSMTGTVHGGEEGL